MNFIFTMRQNRRELSMKSEENASAPRIYSILMTSFTYSSIS